MECMSDDGFNSTIHQTVDAKPRPSGYLNDRYGLGLTRSRTHIGKRSTIAFYNSKKEYKESLKKAIRAQLKLPISKKPKRQQLYYLYKMIMNRRMFVYSLQHVFRYFLKCYFCRSNKSLL